MAVTSDRRASQRGAIGRLAGALLLVLVASDAHAVDPNRPFHEYVRDTWSVEHGLPQLAAMSLAQTPDGYLWVGTQRGLARFDGVSFRTYQVRNTPELPSEYIDQLFVDSGGRLWIGTNAGVAVREPDGSFRSVGLFEAKGDRRLATNAHGIAQLPSGEIVVATVSGLMRTLDGTQLRVDPKFSGKALAVTADADGLLVGTDGAIVRVREGAPPRAIPLPSGLERVPVTGLERRDGKVWVGTEAGLFVIEGDQARRAPLPKEMARSPVTMLFSDRSGVLWVGMRDGLVRVRVDGASEVIRAPNLSHLEAALEDQEGNLWLGSRLSSLWRLWDGWVDRYTTPEGLDRPVVWSVATRRAGGLWIGTSAGVRILQDGRFSKPAGFEGLEAASIYGFFEEGDRVLIGTNLGVQVHRGGATSPFASGSPFDSQRVFGIARDRGGRLIVATDIGMFRERVGGFEQVVSDPLEDSYFMRNLIATRDGRVFGAAQGGVFEVGPTLRRLPLAERGSSFQGLTIDAEGRLLVGDSAGNLWVERGGVLRRFGREHGLPENYPSSLNIDRNGTLWVAGLLGLFRVPYPDFDALLAGRIGRLRGQMVLSISGRVPGAQRSFCCNGGGNQAATLTPEHLWLTTPDGVVRVPVADLPDNKVIPQVHVERIHFADGWREASPDQTLELPRDARDVQFEFTANSFRDPKSVLLEYSLEGYDEGWHKVQDTAYRRTNYTNLPPGDYVFRVRGANDSGAWNERQAQQRFTVPARLHETRWFLALLALLFGGTAYGAFRWRLRLLELERQRLERAVAQRTEELAEANRQLQEASETDPLTRLKNRRFLYDQLPADIANLQRRLNVPEGQRSALGFLVVDADHFKQVNDRYGHDVGDDVLRRLARVLSEAVRPGDFVVRWGGEEFMVVLRDMRAGDLALVAENLRSAVSSAEYLDQAGAPLAVTASIGGIEYPLVRSAPKALSWQKHVELADLALYAAKKAGRDTWAVAEASPEAPELLTPRLANGPTAEVVSAGVAVTRLRA
jgi:diguanylate cyclase (GGDEF)-like protein